MAWLKRNIKPLLLTAVFAVVAALFTALSNKFDETYYTVPSFVITAFCHIKQNDDLSMTLTIIATMFVQIIPLLSIFKRDFKTELWYCITRYRSRKRWFFQKIGSVFVMSLFSATMYFLTVLSVLVLGGAINAELFAENAKLFLWLFLLRFFYIMFFALLLNIISIGVKVRYIVAFGAGLTFIFGAASVAEIRAGLSATLNPYVHATYYFHPEITQYLEENEIIYYFGGMPLWQSAIYFIACFATMLLVGVILTEKLELGLLEED